MSQDHLTVHWKKKFSKVNVRKSYDAPSYLNSANIQWASEPELGVNTTDLTWRVSFWVLYSITFIVLATEEKLRRQPSGGVEKPLTCHGNKVPKSIIDHPFVHPSALRQTQVGRDSHLHKTGRTMGDSMTIFSKCSVHIQRWTWLELE